MSSEAKNEVVQAGSCQPVIEMLNKEVSMAYFSSSCPSFLLVVVLSYFLSLGGLQDFPFQYFVHPAILYIFSRE